MWAPRFSIRALLIILTGGAILFLIAGMAVRGNRWAWGFPIAVGSVLLFLIVSAFWFGLLSLFAPLLAKRLFDETNPPPAGTLPLPAKTADPTSPPTSLSEPPA